MKAQWRRGLELNTNERMALGQLWLCEPMTMSELGERIFLSRAAVTSLVDNLEADKYVTRSTDPLDRRRTVLRLTPLSEFALAAVSDGFAEELTEMAGAMDAAEWEYIARFLDTLREMAGEHAKETRLKSTSDQVRDRVQRARDAS